MNPKQRQELAEKLAMRIDPEATPGFARHGRALSKAYEAIQMVLEAEVDRAVPCAEPDAETAYGRGVDDGYVLGLDSARRHIATMKKPLDMYEISHEIGEEMRGYRRDVASGKEHPIAAMPSCADADWLDDAHTALTTDGLPGTAVSIYRHDNEWGAQQMTTYLKEPDSPTDICGHGATAREAILDAVRKAKGASGE